MNSVKATFVDDGAASIATWHGVAPSSDSAGLSDLEKRIREFEALGGLELPAPTSKIATGNPGRLSN